MAIALVGSVQHGLNEYPGSENYDFSVVLGSAVAGRRIVFGVHGAFDDFSTVVLDPSGTNTSGTISATDVLTGGGNYIQMGYVDVPSGSSGTQTIRFWKGSGGEQYDSCQVEMWVVTGHDTGAPKAASADVDDSFPYQPIAVAGVVAATNAIFIVGTPFDTSASDAFIGVGSEAPTYSEGAGGTYAYARAYKLSCSGGTYNTIQLGSGGSATNQSLGVGVIVLAEAAGGGGDQTLTQTARFDDSDTFFAGVLTKTYQITQSARYDDADTFYSGVVSATFTITQGSRFNDADTFFAGVLSASYAIVQASRFDDADTFYAGTISTGGNDLSQASRFDDADTFYGGTVSATYTITQASRFDDADTFFAGVVTLGGAPQDIVQSSRFNNSNSFFAGVLTFNAMIVQDLRYDDPDTFFSPITVTGGIPIDTTGRGGGELFERRRRRARGYR